MNRRIVLAFALISILAFSLGYCIATLTTQYRVGNLATIKVIGVNVYSDQNCTQPVANINWGTLEPGTTKTVIVYAKSLSSVPLTLTIYAENWNPTNASNYMTLTPSPNNVSMQPSEIKQVSLTLTVASNVTGIINFSFDIVFNGSG